MMFPQISGNIRNLLLFLVLPLPIPKSLLGPGPVGDANSPQSHPLLSNARFSVSQLWGLFAVSSSLKGILFPSQSLSPHTLSCHWAAKKNRYMTVFCTSLHNHFLTTMTLFHFLPLKSVSPKFKIASNCQVQWLLLCFSSKSFFLLESPQGRCYILLNLCTVSYCTLCFIGFASNQRCTDNKHSLSLNSRYWETSYPATWTMSVFCQRTYISPQNHVAPVWDITPRSTNILRRNATSVLFWLSRSLPNWK